MPTEALKNSPLIENGKYSKELESIVKVHRTFPRMMPVGSTWIKLNLFEDRDHALAGAISRTHDLDVLISDRDLNTAILRSDRSAIEARNLYLGVREVAAKTDGRPSEHVFIKSPFKVIGLLGVDREIQRDSLDIFTPSTGVGVIPVNEKVMNSAKSVKIGGVEVRNAPFGFAMATQINPHAYTRERAARLFYVISQYVMNHSQEEYRSEVIGVFSDHIGEGSKAAGEAFRTKAVQDEFKKLQRRNEDGPLGLLSDYDSEVRKVGKLLGRQADEFESAARSVGLRNRKTIDSSFRALTSSMSEYRGGERDTA
ncbi:Uncharacterised protein [uncultured archaeon]|nr:Uncharacterised protein [uncultured archaeon]